jgi:choline dehydrogenase-like flavoprotein
VRAGRLIEDPTALVTLSDGGGRDSLFLYRVPGGYVGLMKTRIGKGRYESEPQPRLDERTINGLAYVCGNACDFDQWAQCGNRGSSYADCTPYFRQLARFNGGAVAFRGGSGLIGVARSRRRSLECGRRIGDAEDHQPQHSMPPR